MKSDELVTVIVPTHNRSQSIHGCLEALTVQSHKNLQIIVSDDGSTDETAGVVERIMQSDTRIELIHSPENNGIAVARNQGIGKARANFIFFTDDDVRVPENWIVTGLEIFEKKECAGVEGPLTYVADTYKPRYSDRAVGHASANSYMTGNVAYRRDVLYRAGLFNESLQVMEDRDLAIRVLKYGTIEFSDEFKAVHLHDRYTIKSFFREPRRSNSWLDINLIHNQRNRMLWVIFQPHKLLALVCPPLILGSCFGRRFEGPFDYLLLFMLYPRLWYERILVWRWAIQHRKFII